MTNSLRKQRANALRFLSIDAVDQANSGHPGMPMGMADIAEVLWHQFMHHAPSHPAWANRDRFVLSNGHGCMLLYSLLHLTGYDLPIEELKRFRQLYSSTPGHPEFGHTKGVETTTGPLGQGLANAVGMAIAEKHMAAIFNRPGFELINHFVYCFVGDGDLMEGISHEVCSLAGTLKLNKLIVFYDDNGISIDGDVTEWFSDNTPLRFESYGWHVIRDVDGHHPDAIEAAIKLAQAETNRPTLICCKTQIGFGSPNFVGKESVHGAPLGAAEIALVRKALDWNHAPFEVPAEIRESWDAREAGEKRYEAWQQLFSHYADAFPDLAAEWTRRQSGELPAQFDEIFQTLVETLQAKPDAMATRKASQHCLNQLAMAVPDIFGGSADLTESNCTNWKGMVPFEAREPAGRYLHYGVREFGMSAIMNGISLYGGMIPYGGTFLTFSDYARNAIRLAALMKRRVIFVYSHDSIGLGEDGPTHQPIEQLPSLRLMPGLAVWRPCDPIETAVAWREALKVSQPTALLLSRQALPFQTRNDEQIAAIEKGGYVLWEAGHKAIPDFLLIATGSEVCIAMDAAKRLVQEGYAVRVVSMPSVDRFLQQSESYQAWVLPNAVKARLVIEAAATGGWYRFVGSHGAILGLDQFGYSAPAKAVYEAVRITADHAVDMAHAILLSVNQAKQLSATSYE